MSIRITDMFVPEMELAQTHAILRRLEDLTGRRQLLKGSFLPGPMPAALKQTSLEFIQAHRSEFDVTVKLDGQRVFLYQEATNTGRPGYSWLIDRELNILCFNRNTHHIDASGEYLVDAELIRDTSGNLSLVVFDCLCWDGKRVVKSSYRVRLGYLHRNTQCLWPAHRENCVILEKPVHPVSAVNLIVSTIVTNDEQRLYTWDGAYGRQFPIDGLIFMFNHSDVPFLFDHRKQPHGLLKFKYCNTIDVMVCFNKRPTRWYEAYFHVYGKCTDETAKFHKVKFTRALNAELIREACDGAHICLECQYQSVDDTWKAVRWRKDKTRSNSKHTILDTLRVLSENITIHDLVRSFGRPERNEATSLDLIAVQFVPFLDAWRQSRNASLEFEAGMRFKPGYVLSVDRFEKILSGLRLRFKDELVLVSTDFSPFGRIRLTREAGKPDTCIQKQLLDKRDFVVKGVEGTVFRLTVKTETPVSNTFTERSLAMAPRRIKHRHRFVHPEWFIDCTRITDGCTNIISYECEIEARACLRHSCKSSSDICKSLLMKLVVYFVHADANVAEFTMQ
jgi:hypothetical protein